MASYQFTETCVPEELANCVTESARSVFNMIFGKAPECQTGNGRDINIGEGVVGIISYVGDVNWLMMLALPRKSAEDLAVKFTGFKVSYDSPEMGDVVGELANVLAGDIVARLSGESIKVAMSLPTIMRGVDVEPMLPRGIPSQKLMFKFPEGNVFVKVAGTPQGENLGRRPGS